SPKIRAHSLQANSPASCNRSAMANAWASHGWRKTGPSSSRGMLGTARIAARAPEASLVATSRRLQIGLEGLDRYGQGGIGVRTPQLPPGEPYGVPPWRVLLAGGGRTRKDVATHQAVDDADAPARVARQSPVRLGMHILGAHACPYGKARGRGRAARKRA